MCPTALNRKMIQQADFRIRLRPSTSMEMHGCHARNNRSTIDSKELGSSLCLERQGQTTWLLGTDEGSHEGKVICLRDSVG
jgi:hypothetical protein